MYALYAAQEAVDHANLDVEALDKDRFGVIVASGIGGIREIEDQVLRLHEKGPKRVKPLTLPKALPNMACLLYTSPSPRDMRRSRMPSSA